MTFLTHCLKKITGSLLIHKMLTSEGRFLSEGTGGCDCDPQRISLAPQTWQGRGLRWEFCSVQAAGQKGRVNTSVTQELGNIVEQATTEPESRADSTNLECFPLRTLFCFHKVLSESQIWKVEMQTQGHQVAFGLRVSPTGSYVKQFLVFQSDIGKLFYRRDKSSNCRKYNCTEANPASSLTRRM